MVWVSEPIVKKHRRAEKAADWQHDQPKEAGSDDKNRFQQKCADGGRTRGGGRI